MRRHDRAGRLRSRRRSLSSLSSPESAPPTLVVGDVHGCFDELMELVDATQNEEREIILVGDLVAKGPASVDVVRWAREHRVRAVRGNHDEHCLVYRRTGKLPKKETHREVCRTLREEDWEYLEALPLYLALESLGTIVVHAGLAPAIELAEQSPDDLMNMRSIRADGRVSRKLDGEPWAAQYPGPELVIFGHDAVRGLQEHPHAIGLDTGCVYGGRLTAIRLPERTFVSVAAKRVYQEPS